MGTFFAQVKPLLTSEHSNILFLPFRRTHPVSLSASIRQYISTKYDQHPDMFIRDMDAIDKLRSDAVNCLEAHTSGVRKMTAYAAQLVWMGGKFPIDVSELQKTRAHAGIEGLTRLLRLASTFHGTQRWVSILKDRVR